MSLISKFSIIACLAFTVAAFSACSQNPAPEREISFHVSGMYCEGCVGAVQNRMERFEGVTEVSVSLSDSLVTLKAPENRLPTAEQLSEAISALGYEALLNPEEMP